jgi:putative endonuclease
MKSNNLKKNVRKNIRNVEWFVYILECADKTFYTGITTDLERRVGEHNSKKSDTKYTRTRQPVKLIYSKKFKDRSAASKEEFKIKSLTREEKVKFLTSERAVSELDSNGVYMV